MCAYRGDDRRRYSSSAAANDSHSNYSNTNNYYGYDGPEDTSPSSSTGGALVRVGGHSRPGSGGGANAARDPERSYRDRVNQIVQNYFWKAMLVIVTGRMTVPPSISRTGDKKLNKWFNIDLDEMDAFREELGLWRTFDAVDARPPPLIIETFIDTKDLTATQALVILDQKGKRWNVSESLEDAANRNRVGMGPKKGVDKAHHQIVLERWRVELSQPQYETGPRQELPVVYKKCIILFRELYSYIYLMPTHKLRKRLSKPKLQPSALRVFCRIVDPDDLDSRGAQPGLDTLSLPLCDDPGNPVEKYEFGKVDTPVGCFSMSVQYRENCDFRVDDSEALLSSQFINFDEHRHREMNVRQNPTPSSFARIHQRTSSQPVNYRDPSLGAPSPVLPPYGSLSTYHQANHSVSPISALRAAAEYADRMAAGMTSSSNSSAAQGLHPSGSQASLRSLAGAQSSRRGSITFMQPFKSPSLSSSPAVGDAANRPSTADRGSSAGSVPVRPHRLSVETSSPSPGNTQAAPVSSSPLATEFRPQPMTRITSSFGSRRPRTNTTNNDDASSSGQASYASIPGGNSSYEEDLQIRDFMTLITDSQKRPPAFVSRGQTNDNTSNSSSSGSSERKTQRPASTINPLAKFQKIQESQAQLAESMSSSLVVLSTSQRLGNPHSPAVPSRLSEGLSASSNNTPTPPIASSPGKHQPSASSAPPASSRLMTIQQGKLPTTVATSQPRDIPTTTTTTPRMKLGRSNSMSIQHPHAVDAELPTSSYDSARNTSDVRLPLEISSTSATEGSQRRGTTASIESTSTTEETGHGGSGGMGRGVRRPGVERRTPSWSRTGLEDEDLLFAMSDVVTGSGGGRKSGEGGRGVFGQQGSGRFGVR